MKCRCPKWPRMSHLDIWSPSYGQKKGRESNWQFDSRPLKVRNRPLPDVYRRSAMAHWKALEESYNFGSNLTPIGGWIQEIWVSKVSGIQLGTVSRLPLVLGKSAIWMWLPQSNAENTIWGKVVASPKSGPWWVKWVQGRPWLVPTPNGCKMSSNQLGVGFGCKIV